MSPAGSAPWASGTILAFLLGCGTTAEPPVDEDGDGVSAAAGDCDDSRALVHPGAAEACDGVDNNCDGAVDEGCGCPEGATQACYDGPPGTRGVAKCADGAQVCQNLVWGSCTGAVLPGVEVCNRLDDDCDGQVDDGVAKTFYLDADGDLFGDATRSITACIAPAGYVELPGDCNDDDFLVRPGFSEVTANGVDDNCDGLEACFVDADRDSTRALSGTVDSTDLDCSDPGEAYANTPLDCDDSNAAIGAGVPEVPVNGVDDDCDGAEECYADLDKDGYGTKATVASADLDCDDPGEAKSPSPGDCNDTNAAQNPGAAEVPGNGLDDDCDNKIDEP